MAEEPKCPACGAEVEIGQKMCAWCGADLPLIAPAPAAPTPVERTSHSATEQPVPNARPSRVTVNGNRGVASGTIPTIDEARNLARSGDLDGALTMFERVLDNDSTNAEALFGIGGVHFKRGDRRKAAEAWLKLKRINPVYPHIDSWLSQVSDALPSAKPQPAPPPAPRPRPSTVSPEPEASPSAFPRRPTQPHPRPPLDHGLDSHDGDDDWTRQSVRVDTTRREEVEPEPVLDQQVNKSVPPTAEPIPQFKPNPVPIWVTLISWVLVVGYAVLFVGIYFLTE